MNIIALFDKKKTVKKYRVVSRKPHKKIVLFEKVLFLQGLFRSVCIERVKKCLHIGQPGDDKPCNVY